MVGGRGVVVGRGDTRTEGLVEETGEKEDGRLGWERGIFNLFIKVITDILLYKYFN